MSHLPDEPVIVLTASDVEMLWGPARLNDLRIKHRSGDTRLYELLVKMHRLRLRRLTNADNGNQPRQPAASEEREKWTVKQLAQVTGRAMRTIRLDIEQHVARQNVWQG